MARFVDEEEVVDFNWLTERLRQGKVGFRRESIPEIAAWLCVHAMGYKRLLGHLRTPSCGYNDKQINGLKEHCMKSIETLQSLMNSIGKGWNRWEWNEATGYIAEQLGIDHDIDLPKKFDKLKEATIYTGVQPCLQDQEIQEPDSLPVVNVQESPPTFGTS